MKLKIILGFFALFAVISYLIQVPMFPGNYLCTSIGRGLENNSQIFSALFNGVFYGTIMGLIFLGVSRKISK
jgi:hypothetical protein